MKSELNTPLVSVVIPAYGHAQYIEGTLQSIFQQTFQDFEIIVVNDGSPDDTAARLRPLAEMGRIRYFDQVNAGQSAARNVGARQARGEFIAFLDDDDQWPPDKLQWQVARMRGEPAAVAVYGFAHLRGNGQDFRLPPEAGPTGSVKPALLLGDFIVSPGQVLLRTADLHALGGLDERIRGADDWDLWLRLADLGHFIYEDRCALEYRYHEANASRNVRYMFETQLAVMHKHLGRTPFSSQWKTWLKCRRHVGRGGATLELGKAAAAHERRETLNIMRHLMGAIRYDPPLLGSRRVWKFLIPAPQKRTPTATVR